MRVRWNKVVPAMIAVLMLLAACTPAATQAPAPAATQPPAAAATEAPAGHPLAEVRPPRPPPPPQAPAPAATQPPAAAATEAPAVDPMAELYAAAAAEGMLTTIALPHDWCNYEAVFEGFKAEDPGIEVNELDPGAGSGEGLEAIRGNMGN